MTHFSDDHAQRYLDGLLPEPVQLAADEHLECCAECQVLVESYRALSEALAGIDVPQVPLHFTAGVMARIEKRERVLAWEQAVAFGILSITGVALLAFAVAAGGEAWGQRIGAWSQTLAQTRLVIQIGSAVIPAVVSALRLQIAVSCLALGVPLILALRRFMPARAVVFGGIE